LPFELWIFRNGQPDRNDDRIIFVTMISIYEQSTFINILVISLQSVFLVKETGEPGEYHRPPTRFIK